MAKKSFLNSIDGKFPWSFVGCLIGVAALIVALYFALFYKRGPDLRLDILSSSPVLSIQEGVPDIKIIFKGQDIRQAHQVLTMINVKLANYGNAAVRHGDFDPKAPFSLNIEKGELVEVKVTGSSNLYLKDDVFAGATIDKESIRIPSFIMEPSEFISLNLLILHSDRWEPSLTIKGKVAGVPEIPVIDSSTTSPVSSTRSFGGIWWWIIMVCFCIVSIFTRLCTQMQVLDHRCLMLEHESHND